MGWLVKLKLFFLRVYMRKLCSKNKVDHKPSQSIVSNIGLWQLGGVGDMLLATPVIEALRKEYPNAQIDVWCSHPQFAEFLTCFEHVNIKSAFSVYDFDARTLWKKEVRDALANLLTAMSEQPYDILVNLHVPALLDWWAVEWWLQRKLKPKFTLGFHPNFLSERSLHDVSVAGGERKNMHYTKLYQRLLNRAGIDCDLVTLFPITIEEREDFSALLKASSIHYDTPMVCMHIGGRRLKVENKMWPIKYFAVLASKLLDDGITPVLIGVEKEMELGEQLCALVPEVINMIGHTKLRDMAALINQADVFVGHDSGPFHIAVARNTPAIVICGRPDSEPEYLKYEKENVAVLTADSPELILVDEVYKNIQEVMKHE